MNFADHVNLSDWHGQCLLTVDDFELHDFLDDLFTEQGHEAQIVHPSGSPTQYQLLFAPGISRATVYRLLCEVGPGEIDRIVRIKSRASTNPGGGA